jgi:hypothetical protein
MPAAWWIADRSSHEAPAGGAPDAAPSSTATAMTSATNARSSTVADSGPGRERYSVSTPSTPGPACSGTAVTESAGVWRVTISASSGHGLAPSSSAAVTATSSRTASADGPRPTTSWTCSIRAAVPSVAHSTDRVLKSRPSPVTASDAPSASLSIRAASQSRRTSDP